jgi:hypothetical protein
VLSSTCCGFPTIADELLTATITWDTIFVAPGNDFIQGTGIVTTSSGDDPFEADFPVGGTFDIRVGWFQQPFAPFPGAGGGLTPTTIAAVPAPPIGVGWVVALLTLAVITIRSSQCVGSEFCRQRGAVQTAAQLMQGVACLDILPRLRCLGFVPVRGRGGSGRARPNSIGAGCVFEHLGIKPLASPAASLGTGEQFVR